MKRLLAIALTIGALVSTACDSTGGCINEEPQWESQRSFAAGLEAPSELGLPGDMSHDCGCSGDSSCAEGGTCTPSFCLATTASGAPRLVLGVGMLRSVLPGERIALPSSDVEVIGYWFAGEPDANTMKVEYGEVEFLAASRGFDAKFWVRLTSGDVAITVDNGRYTSVDGQWHTVCTRD